MKRSGGRLAFDGEIPKEAVLLMGKSCVCVSGVVRDDSIHALSKAIGYQRIVIEALQNRNDLKGRKKKNQHEHVRTASNKLRASKQVCRIFIVTYELVDVRKKRVCC